MTIVPKNRPKCSPTSKLGIKYITFYWKEYYFLYSKKLCILCQVYLVTYKFIFVYLRNFQKSPNGRKFDQIWSPWSQPQKLRIALASSKQKSLQPIWYIRLLSYIKIYIKNIQPILYMYQVAFLYKNLYKIYIFTYTKSAANLIFQVAFFYKNVWLGQVCRPSRCHFKTRGKCYDYYFDVYI
jgi:hypothetical protein